MPKKAIQKSASNSSKSSNSTDKNVIQKVANKSQTQMTNTMPTPKLNRDTLDIIASHLGQNNRARMRIAGLTTVD